MTRLLIDKTRLAEPLVTIAGDEHRYLTRVLRVEVGDHVVLFDGLAEEAEAEVTRIGPRATELRVIERRTAVILDRPSVTLVQALSKGDKLDFIIQKSTELGVMRIVPVSSARAVVRPEPGRAMARQVRWQKIAREAARQSGRVDIPEVSPVTPLETALHEANPQALRLFLWEGARSTSLRSVLPAKKPANSVDGPLLISLVVGPEGGFANDEVDLARSLGFHVVGLGPRVLRTETAPIVALSILGYRLGDLG